MTALVPSKFSPAAARSGPRRTKARARVLLVDDHPLMLETVGHLVRHTPGLQLCGSEASAGAAFAAILKKKPDLVVTDLGLGELNGFELIKAVLAQRPRTRFLVLSMHKATFCAERALRAGAQGYVMKGEGAGPMIAAIQCILAGGLAFDDATLRRTMQTLVGPLDGGATPFLESFSGRERLLFAALGAGGPEDDLARRIGMEPEEITAGLERLRAALHVSDDAAVINYAKVWHRGGEQPAAEKRTGDGEGGPGA